MIKVGKNCVVAFAKIGNYGGGTMELKADNMSRSELERLFALRFTQQRTQLEKRGFECPHLRGIEFVWLDSDEISRPTTKEELALDQEPRIWTIEEKDGHYKPVKIETELMTATECKLEIMKRMGF